MEEYRELNGEKEGNSKEKKRKTKLKTNDKRRIEKEKFTVKKK